MSKLKGYKEIPIGGTITKPGGSVEYKTGDWRNVKPVWTEENCIHCLFCWVFCPDNAIEVKDGKMTGINYDYCKGCGICARECPTKDKALHMVKES